MTEQNDQTEDGEQAALTTPPSQNHEVAAERQAVGLSAASPGCDNMTLPVYTRGHLNFTLELTATPDGAPLNGAVGNRKRGAGTSCRSSFRHP